jgi:hypothetical protein
LRPLSFEEEKTMQTIDVLKALYPGLDVFQDVNLVQTSAGVVIGHWNAAKLGPQPTMEELEARAKDLPPPPPPPPTIEERLAKLETDVSTLKGAKI